MNSQLHSLDIGTHVQIWDIRNNDHTLITTISKSMTEKPIGNEKLTRQELFGEPRHILNHSRALLIEQLMWCCGGGKSRRAELNAMPYDELKKTWDDALGNILEGKGI